MEENEKRVKKKNRSEERNEKYDDRLRGRKSERQVGERVRRRGTNSASHNAGDTFHPVDAVQGLKAA